MSVIQQTTPSNPVIFQMGPSDLANFIIQAKELPKLQKVAFRALQFFVLTLALGAGTVIGGLIGSVIPFYGTIVGASLGGAIFFTIALTFLDRVHNKWEDAAIKNYAAQYRLPVPATPPALKPNAG